MPKIVLDVPDAQLQSVMNILKSLKSELISNIEVDMKTVTPVSSSLNKKHQPYQGKKQEEARPIKPTSKYLSPDEYKKRLTRK